MSEDREPEPSPAFRLAVALESAFAYVAEAIRSSSSALRVFAEAFAAVDRERRADGAVMRREYRRRQRARVKRRQRR